jgi:hypothetical protein
MDSTKSVNEVPAILPSLEGILQTDIDILDNYFRKMNRGNEENKQAISSWDNVREAAISFAETFDRVKDDVK